MTIPSDYDDDTGRWRNNRAVRARFGSGDLHGRVARRFVAEGLAPVLDVGCGNGDLAAELPRDWPWIGVDPSPTQLAAAPRPTALAVATELPAAGASVGAVAFLWMLYHVDEPAAALAEARRVLRPGGLVAACTNSRFDSPELAAFIDRRPSPFDAEDAPDLVGRVFDDVETHSWDAPLYHLPDAGAVRDYLMARLVPQERAEPAAAAVDVPLDVTKRGVLVFGRKR